MKFCSIEGCSLPNFSKDTKTGLPYCRSHQYKRSDYDRRTIMQKALDKNKSLNSKVRGLTRPTEEDNLLELFFLACMNINYPKCDNCGAIKESLLNWKQGWKSCQAHLLPKRHFKSISTNTLNLMVLGSGYSGLCNCHDNYDSSWDAASKMNIWNDVVARFKILYPLIRKNEHQFIPQLLLDALNT